MLVNNGQFIQLSYDNSCSASNGQPLYIDSKKISIIRPTFDVNGHANGSYVYLDGNTKECDPLPVKENPEYIIGLINDGIFCAFNSKTLYDRIPYPKK